MFKVVFTREGAPQSGPCETGCRQDPECASFGSCPTSGADVADADTERWERLFWPAMKEQGVFLTPNQFESQFVSYAHTEADVEETIETYRTALSDRV
jgi:glutamate-1-semialdehyde 2,1-aminomutase